MDHIANMLQYSVVPRFCSLSRLKLPRSVFFLSLFYIFLVTTHALASRLQQAPQPGPEPGLSPKPQLCPSPGSELGPSPKSSLEPGPKPYAEPEPKSSPEPAQNPRITPAPALPAPSSPKPKPKPFPNPEPSPKPSSEPGPKPSPRPAPLKPPSPEPRPKPCPCPEPSPNPSLEPGPKPGQNPRPSPKPWPPWPSPTPWQPWPSPKPSPRPAPIPAPPTPPSPEPRPKPCQCPEPSPNPSPEPGPKPWPPWPSPTPWQPWPSPKPSPESGPNPSPRPAPPPRPPSPEPRPKPGPCSGPSPKPSPEPRPKSCPSPRPSPKPSPEPEPKPGPSPKPTPAPPGPPSPKPRPKPGPSPKPSPEPGPRPSPNPKPSLPPTPPSPKPRPKPGPNPGPSSKSGPSSKPGPSLKVGQSPKPFPEPRPKPNPRPAATPKASLAPRPSPKPAPPRPHNTMFPAIFAFGDSILDTGNNDYILTLIRANFLPYGMNFPHGVPTGRFCNGKIPSDFIAEFLGVKPTLPPYLRPGLTQEDLLTGVSFASGGSGYDPMTPFVVSAIPMSEQLTSFQEYIEKVKGFVGLEKADHIISKSLAIVIAGSDDLANTYYGSHIRQFLYDIDSYTSFMANSAASFAMQLYESGARKIGFIGVSPIGCIPIQRTTRGGLERKCADDLNFAAQLFNTKLSTSLHSVAKTIKNATLVYIDIYSLFTHMIQNPKEYGFDEIDRGCCGTGLVELGPLCNRFTSLLCKNVSSYMFWDSYHPTERAYRILSKKFIETGMGPFYDK